MWRSKEMGICGWIKGGGLNKFIMSELKPYTGLIQQIGELLNWTSKRGGLTILVQTYWQIGKHYCRIHRRKSKSGIRFWAVRSHRKDLTLNLGKGFSRSNLVCIKWKFYLRFLNSETSPPIELVFTISKYWKPDNLEISFYTKQSRKGKLERRTQAPDEKHVVSPAGFKQKTKQAFCEIWTGSRKSKYGRYY